MALRGQSEFPLSYLDTYFMAIDLVLVLRGRVDRRLFCEALSQTLALFPPLSGRFQYPSLESHGELKLQLHRPIPVFWLPDSLSSFDRSEWKNFVRSINGTRIRKGQDEPLCQIAVTFAPQSSATIIGVSFAHLLGDASAMYRFLQAWSDIYATGSMTQKPPILNRLRFDVRELPAPAQMSSSLPRRLPGRSQKLAFGAWEKVAAYGPLVYTVVFKTVEYAHFQVPAAALELLRIRVQSQMNSVISSTQDAFKGYLVKALNRYVYNGLTSVPRVTRVVTIVDARRTRGLADEYFGNCLTATDTPYLAASKSLSDIACEIRKGIQALSAEKLKAGDDWIRSIQSINGLMDLVPAFDPDAVYINDWTKNTMESVNFGLEQLQNCQPLEVETLPVRNWCMIYRGHDCLVAGTGRFAFDVQISVPRGKAAALVSGIQWDIEEDFAEYFW